MNFFNNTFDKNSKLFSDSWYTMTSSAFKKVVRLQFNALMMRTIKGTLKQKRKQLARCSKHEILFSEISSSPLYEQDVIW